MYLDVGGLFQFEHMSLKIWDAVAMGLVTVSIYWAFGASLSHMVHFVVGPSFMIGQSSLFRVRVPRYFQANQNPRVYLAFGIFVLCFSCFVRCLESGILLCSSRIPFFTARLTCYI